MSFAEKSLCRVSKPRYPLLILLPRNPVMLVFSFSFWGFPLSLDMRKRVPLFLMGDWGAKFNTIGIRVSWGYFRASLGWSPHPVILTTRENGNSVRVLQIPIMPLLHLNPKP